MEKSFLVYCNLHSIRVACSIGMGWDGGERERERERERGREREREEERERGRERERSLKPKLASSISSASLSFLPPSLPFLSASGTRDKGVRFPPPLFAPVLQSSSPAALPDVASSTFFFVDGKINFQKQETCRATYLL